jgi:hypothetical protein
MNIVLDMDGTLINEHMEPRPYLKMFFEFVFEKFQHVSIWTYASTEWFEMVFHKVFKPILPEGKTFHFVWCRVHCKVSTRYNPFTHLSSLYIIKPLTEVYRRFPHIYHTYNTFFIDDTPSTYDENRQNAIQITTFRENLLDNELLKIIRGFERRMTKE